MQVESANFVLWLQPVFYIFFAEASLRFHHVLFRLLIFMCLINAATFAEALCHHVPLQ